MLGIPDNYINGHFLNAVQIRLIVSKLPERR